MMPRLKPGNLGFISVVILTLVLIPVRFCHGSDTKIEAGPGVLSRDFSHGYGVILTEIWEGKYAVSLGVFSDQEFNHVHVDENMFVMAHRLFTYKRLQLGFGVTLWENTNRALGQRFTFQEQIGVSFYKNWDINYRHWSNGGTAKPNAGQNILSIGYTF
jgi:hypothetical protein